MRWSHWTTERTRTIGPFRGCQSTGATYGTFQQCMQCVEIHTNAGNQFANNLRCGPALCTRHTRTGDAERATTALLRAPVATVRVGVCYVRRGWTFLFPVGHPWYSCTFLLAIHRRASSRVSHGKPSKCVLWGRAYLASFGGLVSYCHANRYEP